MKERSANASSAAPRGVSFVVVGSTSVFLFFAAVCIVATITPMMQGFDFARNTATAKIYRESILSTTAMGVNVSQSVNTTLNLLNHLSTSVMRGLLRRAASSVDSNVFNIWPDITHNFNESMPLTISANITNIQQALYFLTFRMLPVLMQFNATTNGVCVKCGGDPSGHVFGSGGLNSSFVHLCQVCLIANERISAYASALSPSFALGPDDYVLALSLHRDQLPVLDSMLPGWRTNAALTRSSNPSFTYVHEDPSVTHLSLAVVFDGATGTMNQSTACWCPDCVGGCMASAWDAKLVLPYSVTNFNPAANPVDRAVGWLTVGPAATSLVLTSVYRQVVYTTPPVSSAYMAEVEVHHPLSPLQALLRTAAQSVETLVTPLLDPIESGTLSFSSVVVMYSSDNQLLSSSDGIVSYNYSALPIGSNANGMHPHLAPYISWLRGKSLSIASSHASAIGECVPGEFVRVVRTYMSTAPLYSDVLNVPFTTFWPNVSAECSGDPDDLLVYTAKLYDGGVDWFNSSRPVHANIDYDALIGLIVSYKAVYGVRNASVSRVQTVFAPRIYEVEVAPVLASIDDELFSGGISLVYGVGVPLTFFWIILTVLLYRAVLPLRSIIDALGCVETMNLEHASSLISEASSLFSEFTKLKDGVVFMINRLEDYRRFMPQWLLERDSGNDLLEAAEAEPLELGKSFEKAEVRSRGSVQGTSLTSRSSKHGHAAHAAPIVAVSEHVYRTISVVVFIITPKNEQPLTPKLIEQLIEAFLTDYTHVGSKGTLAADLVHVGPGAIVFSVPLNAQKRIRQAPIAALDLASAVCRAASSSPIYRAHAGAAMGSCMLGSWGTTRNKWYLISGNPTRHARAFATYAFRESICAAVSEGRMVQRAKDELKSYRLVNTGIIFVDGSLIRSSVVAGPLEQSADEWMYMLEDAANQQDHLLDSSAKLMSLLESATDANDFTSGLEALRNAVDDLDTSDTYAPILSASATLLTKQVERVQEFLREGRRAKLALPSIHSSLCIDPFVAGAPQNAPQNHAPDESQEEPAKNDTD